MRDGYSSSGLPRFWPGGCDLIAGCSFPLQLRTDSQLIWADAAPCAAPRAGEVRSSPAAGTLYERLLNLQIQRGAGVQGVMVRENLRLVIARPELVGSCAPLPSESEGLVTRESR